MVNDKEKNFISAVVYVRNNEKTVKDFLLRINKALSAVFNKYEIICVNDASYDDSAKVIKEISDSELSCPLSIVNMSFEQGLEMSMNAGVDLAIGDFVFEFDSVSIDFDESVISEIYFHSLKGFDIVSAVSDRKKQTSSKLFYRFFNKHANAQHKIGTETFRVLSRRAINRVHSLSKTIPYRKALYANCGLKIDSICYKSTENSKQTTKSSFKFKTATDTLILFTDIGYKLSMALTFLMILATVAIGIYTIVVYLTGQPVPGFTTMMLVMTGAFFGIFAILTIIIKYLSLLVDLIFKKQRYIIESIEKVNK